MTYPVFIDHRNGRHEPLRVPRGGKKGNRTSTRTGYSTRIFRDVYMRQLSARTERTLESEEKENKIRKYFS